MNRQSEAEGLIESQRKPLNQILAEISHQHDMEYQSFKRACTQILQLNGKLDDLTKRYKAAMTANDKNFRCRLRCRMLVVEGVLTTYCNYANVKKQKILILRRQLQLAVRHSGEADSDSDTDGDSEEKPHNLLDLIEASTAVERLLEDNKYYCDECNAYMEAERSIHYDIMPDILTLHLKRFSAETGNPGNMTKVNDHIDIPLNLPCLRYRCSQSCLRPDHRYRLYGVVTHSGYTLTSGHYLSYVRTLPNEPSEPISVKVENTARIKSEPKEEAQSPINKIMPSTRRKMGVMTKLPSRFDNNIISDTKVKAFESVAAKKLKTDLAAKLMLTKRFNTEWFECDDETVRVYEESEFVDLLTETSGSLLGTPYLLFYHKATMC